MKYKVTEIVTVLLLSILDTFFILRNTLLTPGLVYVRDSYPPIIEPKPQLVQNGQINIVLLMNNPGLPLLLLQYFLNSEAMDKLYYAYPIALGFISMYFSARYLTGNRVVSAITAFLYTISPTFMYFTYWNNYATFVALYPLLLVGLNYVTKKEVVKGAILLAFIESLTTTDPRGLVFTFITAFAFLIYYTVKSKSLKFLKTFLLSLPVYVLLNVRTFYALIVNHTSYVSLGSGISSVQLWLNYQTYSLADNLRGIGLFVPLVNFYQGNYAVSYIVSFFLPVFTILGFLLAERLWKSANLFYLSFYLFLVVFISSNVVVFGHSFTLNLIYYLNNILKDSPLFPYMWIILPTYLSEMIVAPLFLVFSSVFNEVVKENLHVIVRMKNVNPSRLLKPFFISLLLAVVILGQIIFSYSSYATGNYDGNYQPLPIPKPVYEVAEFLQNATGRVAIYVYSVYYEGKYYNPTIFLGLPNVISVPLYEQNLTNALQYYGVEYVVANKNISFFLQQPGLKEVYNADGIYVFKNEYFKPTYITKGIYLLAGSPNQVPYNMAAVPSYVYVPPQYLAGVIGGTPEEQEVLIKADIFHNYSVKIPAQRLPNPTNFSSTIYVTYGATQILSDFPGISLIQVGSRAEETINVSPGSYAVILSYVQYPEGGVIEISNGTTTLSVNTAGVNYSVRTVFLGYLSGDRIFLIHPDDRETYIVNLELIPSSLYKQNITLHPHNVTVTIYPAEGDVIPSVGYNIIVGKAEEVKNPNLLPILLLNLLTFLGAIQFYRKYNSRKDH